MIHMNIRFRKIKEYKYRVSNIDFNSNLNESLIIKKEEKQMNLEIIMAIVELSKNLLFIACESTLLIEKIKEWNLDRLVNKYDVVMIDGKVFSVNRERV